MKIDSMKNLVLAVAIIVTALSVNSFAQQKRKIMKPNQNPQKINQGQNKPNALPSEKSANVFNNKFRLVKTYLIKKTKSPSNTCEILFVNSLHYHAGFSRQMVFSITQITGNGEKGVEITKAIPYGKSDFFPFPPGAFTFYVQAVPIMYGDFPPHPLYSACSAGRTLKFEIKDND